LHLRVFNKVDAVDAERRQEIAESYPEDIQISALENTGMEELKGRLMDELERWKAHRARKTIEELETSVNWNFPGNNNIS